MRSLFLKVFLWFWLAMVLIVGALVVTSYLTRTERGPRPPQFIAGLMWAYSRGAVSSYERGGAEGLSVFLGHVEHDAGIRACLFDAQGTELARRRSAPHEREIAVEAARTGGPAMKRVGGLIYEAQPVESREGGRRVFVAAFPFGPAGPPEFTGEQQPGLPRPPRPPGPLGFLRGDSPAAFALRVAVVILTAGVLCYLLARYLVSPVVKLRGVTRRVAGGDLSARVGPLLGRRRDELADMGHDFDAMAARIEALLGAQARLLRDISHELRSPLARLSVALDLARKRAGPEAAGHLARIEREAGRLNEMIGQLLSLSRRETGGAGLGLAITERAVRLHGGNVTASNVAGGGFVVEIRLPPTQPAGQN